MNTDRASRAQKPTIYEVLAAKLGRNPTNSEINAECRRILGKSPDSDAPLEIIAMRERHDHALVCGPLCPEHGDPRDTSIDRK